MHRPVGPRLAIFARAVDRVDDPDTFFRQALVGVLAFLAQQSVFWALLAQRMDEELVGGLVARFAQCLAAEHGAVADFDQNSARHVGEMGGKFGVGHKSRSVPVV